MHGVKKFTHLVGDVVVVALVASADVVDLSCSAGVVDQVDSLAVVKHVEPVADVLAVTVDRDILTVDRFTDDGRDEFLVMLLRTVVVRAVGDEGVHAVGVVVAADDHVASSF